VVRIWVLLLFVFGFGKDRSINGHDCSSGSIGSIMTTVCAASLVLEFQTPLVV
jgi:hypothetical protein